MTLKTQSQMNLNGPQPQACCVRLTTVMACRCQVSSTLPIPECTAEDFSLDGNRNVGSTARE